MGPGPLFSFQGVPGCRSSVVGETRLVCWDVLDTNFFGTFDGGWEGRDKERDKIIE